MKNRLFSLLIFLTFSDAFTQNCEEINLSINSSSHSRIYDAENDMVFYNICKGETLILNGTPQFPLNKSGTISWLINEELHSQSSQFTHTFNQSGGYIITLSASYDNCTSKNIVHVSVGFEPSIEFNTEIIKACPNDELSFGSAPSNDVLFTKNISYDTWQTPPCEDKFSEPLYLPDGQDESYVKSININCFDEDQVIENINDIEKVFINIEHSFMGDLDIYLTAPNGKTITLFEAAGSSTWFGQATDDDATEENRGEGYDYGWSMNPSFNGAMAEGVAENNVETDYDFVNNQYVSILKSDTYLPNENFSKLIGSPLNGKWTLTVVDTREIDNGWIFYWGVKMKEELLPSTWNIENSTTKEGFISNNTIISDSNESTSIIPKLGENTYVYEVEDNFGCKHSKNLKVQTPNVKALFEASQKNVKNTDAIVEFYNYSTPTNLQYNWDFGNGNYSTDKSPQQNFYSIGTKTVELRITTEEGCTDSYSQEITTVEDYLLWIPTAFTPNGDGMNDDFKISIQNINQTNFKLFIYDSWGKLVFETNDVELGWNGIRKDNGIAAESGSYSFITEFVTNYNSKEEKTGSFLLMK